jgi:hypothetical protein
MKFIDEELNTYIAKVSGYKIDTMVDGLLLYAKLMKFKVCFSENYKELAVIANANDFTWYYADENFLYMRYNENTRVQTVPIYIATKAVYSGIIKCLVQPPSR